MQKHNPNLIFFGLPKKFRNFDSKSAKERKEEEKGFIHSDTCLTVPPLSMKRSSSKMMAERRVREGKGKSKGKWTSVIIFMSNHTPNSLVYSPSRSLSIPLIPAERFRPVPSRRFPLFLFPFRNSRGFLQIHFLQFDPGAHC